MGWRGGGHTDYGKGLEAGDELVLDMLRRVGVVIWAQGVLEEGDVVLRRVEGLELGL